MSDPNETIPPLHKKRLRWPRPLIAVVAGVAVAATAIAVAVNTFGENVHGAVRCHNAPVTGVFIEAERMPRAMSVEVQSGFATWTPWLNFTDVAEFHYWLPLGGAYSIHFGCGELKDGERGVWATDNRTPLVTGSGRLWWCNDPVNNGMTTIVVTDCRSN